MKKRFLAILLTAVFALSSLAVLCLSPSVKGEIPAASLPYALKTNIGALNIRAAADPSSTLLGQVDKDVLLYPVQQVGKWYKFKLSGGAYGYVYGSYVDNATGAGSVSVSAANLRTGPGTEYSSLGTWPRDTAVTLIGREGDWYEVTLSGGNRGYMSKDVLSVPVETYVTLTGASTTFTEKVVAIGSSNANIRTGPSTDYSVITTLPAGTAITLIGEAGTWYQIRMADGRTGYVAGFLVNTSGKATSSTAVVPSDTGLSLKPSTLGVESDQVLQYSYRQSGASFIFRIRGSERLYYTVVEGSNTLKVYTDGSLKAGLASSATIETNHMESLNIADNNGTKVFTLTMDESPAYSLDVQEDGYVLQFCIANGIGTGPLADLTVVVDPGHGSINSSSGYLDSGAVGPSGLKEKDVNLAIALALRDDLVAQGATVIMTRESDVGVLTLMDRVEIANENCADYFISVHCNASDAITANGVETWYSKYGDTTLNPAREAMATAIQLQLKNNLGITSRGIKYNETTDFTVIKYTAMPAVLVESAFISNPTEEALLATSTFRKKVAQSICQGLVDYAESL